MRAAEREAIAATLIQRTVVCKIVERESNSNDDEKERLELNRWVSTRLVAISSGCASNLSNRLADYRMLDESVELPRIVAIWHMLTLAGIAWRHDPASLADYCTIACSSRSRVCQYRRLQPA